MVALSLLREQHGLDIGQNAALGDGDLAQQLVQLLVVADSQLQVTRDDARLLVVSRRIARQLQDFGLLGIGLFLSGFFQICSVLKRQNLLKTGVEVKPGQTKLGTYLVPGSV